MIKVLEGIVIRQTKTTGGRRMVLIFTREEGKVSAGTHLNEKSRGGAALAIRPFAHGHYTITGTGDDRLRISAAEAIEAHFELGEDADRFADASFALEFTDRALPDGARAPEVFDLLKEYLGMMAYRKADFRLLTVSYMVKLMQELGVFPDAASLTAGELLSGVNGDILDVIVFLEQQPLKRMDALTLEGEKGRAVFGAVKTFAREHLDLGTIKSERMLV